MNHFFSSAALSLGPWSISKVKTGLECSKKFELTYVSKPDAALLVPSDTSALDMGTAVHKYSELIAAGTPAAEAKVAAYSDIPKTTGNKTKITNLSRSMENFEKRMASFRETNNVLFDGSEDKFGLTKDLSPCEFYSKEVALRGAVDRYMVVEKNGRKHAIIIDIKTGKEYPIESYALQLEAYGMMLHSKIPELASVQPAIYFAGSEKLVWYPNKLTSDILSPGNLVLDSINKFADNYNPQPNLGRHCSWCQFKKICGLT